MTRILLLDLYKTQFRPFIPPYLYLGAFLDSIDVPYIVARWLDEDDSLCDLIDDHAISHVFINAIMGEMLSVLEQAATIIKTQRPHVSIWIGGQAVFFLRSLLEAHPCIDHVSAGHPNRDPSGFAQELYAYGILDTLPDREIRPPFAANNRYFMSFAHEHLRHGEPIGAVNVSTASGCTNSCSFCYLSRTHAWQYELDDVFADLQAMQERYGMRYFEFSDDNFTQDKGRLREFCRRAIQSDLDLSYFCLASLDTLDRETVELMLESGLQRLFIGVDAIHNCLNHYLLKRYRAETAMKKIAMLREYPIDLSLAFVLGIPDETHQQIQATYDWLTHIQPEFCFASFLTPYAGTRTYQHALKQGFVPPRTLPEWAEVARFDRPVGGLNPLISDEEYIDWARRFYALSSLRFRSQIGDSLRSADRRLQATKSI